MLQFGLVGCRHNHHAGQGGKERRIERACVGRTVRANETGTVDRETNWQILDRHVMHDLIVAALQEGRIQRAERFIAVCGEARSKGDSMLFGNADVEGARREKFSKLVQPGAVRHGSGHANDLLVKCGFLHESFGKNAGVARCVRLGFRLRAGDDIELVDAVIFIGRRFGRSVTLAFLRHNMNEDRTFLVVTHVAQNRKQVLERVTVDRADMVEAQFLEQCAAGHVTACVGHRAGNGAIHRLAEISGQFLAEIAETHVGPARGEAGEIGTHRSRGWCDRHVVVVQNDDQPRIECPGIVQRFECHAGRHGAIADHRDNLAVALVQSSGNSHAKTGRDRRGGMARAEIVVFAFSATGKP